MKREWLGLDGDFFTEKKVMLQFIYADVLMIFPKINHTVSWSKERQPDSVALNIISLNIVDR